MAKISAQKLKELEAAEQKFRPLDTPKTVSYTHLDVYKRQIHALYCGLPAQLGALGQVLQQPEDALKMKEGKALITYFCKPCKPTKRNGGRTRNLPQHDPDKWRLFCKYNGMDVIAERANDRKLAPWPVPESIMQQWREAVSYTHLLFLALDQMGVDTIGVHLAGVTDQRLYSTFR